AEQNPAHQWDPAAENGEGAFLQPYDHPLDSSRADYPLLANSKLVQSYRIVYLQRLANPQEPWDATTNPYLTVDASSVDLFPFNGVETRAKKGAGIKEPGDTSGNAEMFASAQRGEREPAGTSDLWKVNRSEEHTSELQSQSN